MLGSATSEEQLDDKATLRQCVVEAKFESRTTPKLIYLAAKNESLEKELEAAKHQIELIENFLVVKIYTWILQKIDKFLTSVKFAWDMSVCQTLSCWKYTTSPLQIKKFILILLMICGYVLFLTFRFYEVKL